MASFTFCRVEPKDYKEALNLFWNHFMPDEPVTRLVGCCTRTGYRIHNLDKMLSEMLNKRTCWMAKSFEGEMAGVIFCEQDVLKKNPSQTPCKADYRDQGWPEDFTEVMLLLDQLCDHQKLMKDKGVDQLLDLFALVISPNFRKQGLASRLIAKAVSEAEKMLMPLISISCTSSFSQRCSIKLGFSHEKTIAYETWNTVWKNAIDPVHPTAVLYFKYLFV